MGYLSPDRAETLKVRTNYEIESRGILIKNLRDRLMIEQRPVTKELDHVNAEVERLNVELAQCRKKYADSAGDNVQQTNQVELLRKDILQLEEILAEERTISDKLRREIERGRSERELLEEKLRRKLAIHESLDKTITAGMQETGSQKNITDAERIFEPVCSQLGETEAAVKQSKVKPDALENKDQNQRINTNNKEHIKGFRELAPGFRLGWPTAVTPTDITKLQREIHDLRKEYEKLEVRSRQYQTQFEEKKKESRERTAMLERDIEKRSQHVRILLERLRSLERVGKLPSILSRRQS
jgi:chromosome segregation ATPase